MQKKLEIALSIITAIFPALAIYIFLPGTTLASFLLWLFLIPLLIFHKNKQFNYDEIWFLISILFISTISALLHLAFGVGWFDFKLFYHNIYSIILCLLPLCFITNFINVNVFVKTVLFFGVFASLTLVWQWLSLFFTGSFQKDVFFHFLEINRDLESFSIFRPSSFFMEPAHFAIYVLPAFQIALIQKKRVLAYLFAISIVFSGSSTGFILMPILLSYHLFKIGTKKWHIAVFGIMTLLLSIYIVYFLFPDVFLNNFGKLNSVREGKSDLRLLGPLMYLRFFQFFEHFFGITLNQLTNLLMSNNLIVFGGGNYANAIIYMYISFGLIGLVIFLIYLIRKWKSIGESSGFMLIFLGIICSDQILFNGNFFYLACFVLLGKRISNKLTFSQGSIQ